jgi:hypothetical protein
MGQRSHAAFHFLHERWSCHSRQLGCKESWQTGLAWLRAYLTRECSHALCAGGGEWSGEYAGSADRRYSGRRVQVREGPRKSPTGVFRAHLALPITTDRRLTTDRHGPFHAGEVRALARARCAAQSFSSYGRAVPPGRIVVDAAVAMPLLARSLASCTLLVASAIVASYGMVGVRACMRSRPRAGSLGDALQWPRSNSPKRPPSSSGSSPRLAAKIEMPARLQYSICPCRPALAHVAH